MNDSLHPDVVAAIAPRCTCKAMSDGIIVGHALSKDCPVHKEQAALVAEHVRRESFANGLTEQDWFRDMSAAAAFYCGPSPCMRCKTRSGVLGLFDTSDGEYGVLLLCPRCLSAFLQAFPALPGASVPPDEPIRLVSECPRCHQATQVTCERCGADMVAPPDRWREVQGRAAPAADATEAAAHNGQSVESDELAPALAYIDAVAASRYDSAPGMRPEMARALKAKLEEFLNLLRNAEPGPYLTEDGAAAWKRDRDRLVGDSL